MIDTKKQIQANSNSIAVEQVNSQLNALKSNLIGVTNLDLGTDSMLNQFNEFNKYSNEDDQNTYQKSCDSNTKDFWTTTLDACKNGHVKINPGQENDGNKNCLLFSEWNQSQVTSRYSTRPKGCKTGNSEFPTANGGINAYYSALNTFSTSNSILINQMVKENNDSLNSGFILMSGKLLEMIINIEGVLNPLVNIFKKYVGDAGIFQLINCRN